jgi:sulfide dehydrogenase [flavocytochrome c] flavoprotein subunit
MSQISRRTFIKLTTSTAITASVVSFPLIALAATKKVVIIGGGAGGTVAAKTIRIADPTIEVTLIEENKHYYTGFMSNEVLSGQRSIESIKFNYDGLNKYGIKMLYGKALDIDPLAKTVKLHEKTINYDKLIVSPGIDFKWDAIAGYDKNAVEKMPHAWKAGRQTALLRQQLKAMKNGGTVIISVPERNFPCPLAPYERASQIAYYLKQQKPKSKIIILDTNQNFYPRELFMQGWKNFYGFGGENSLIEWIPLEEGGNVVSVDIDEMSVFAGEFEDEFIGDVINVIPPQQAGEIAFKGGLVNKKGWCPVDNKTFESQLQKDIYVIGDACTIKMPKSAQVTTSQAKVCAAGVVAGLQGKEITDPTFNSICYGIIAKDYGFFSGNLYQFKAGKIKTVKGTEILSLLDAKLEDRKRATVAAYQWFKKITGDMFG